MAPHVSLVQKGDQVVDGSQACPRSLSGILRISHDFKAHGKQLMLFTFLTSESKEVEMWGTDGRKVLEEMKQYMNEKAAKAAADADTNKKAKAAADADTDCQPDEVLRRKEKNAAAAKAAAKDEPETAGDKPNMQEILYGTLRQNNLDFSSRVDIMAWFHLRRWVQVDFLDDSASMECAGTVVVLLLANFAFAGFMEWIQKDREVVQAIQGPATWLILSLCLVLPFLLYDVLEACVGINALLERDSRLLLDAEIQQLNQAGQEGTRSILRCLGYSPGSECRRLVTPNEDLSGIGSRRHAEVEGGMILWGFWPEAIHRLSIDCGPQEPVPEPHC